MQRGFPKTLLGYITAEFAKTLCLTIVIVTGLLAFGGAIQFVRHHLVGPREFLMALPPLTFLHLGAYTLPLAVLFGASISYGRMSAENEIRAMEWNGLHVGWVTLPAVVIAVLASIASLYLTAEVAPRSRQRLKTIARTNILNIIDNQLTRAARGGEAIREGNLAVSLKEYDSGTGTMRGVTVVETRGDKIVRTIEAASARIVPGVLSGAIRVTPEDLAAGDQVSYATVTFTGGRATEYDPQTGVVTARGVPPAVAFPVEQNDREKVDDDSLPLGALIERARTVTDESDRRAALSVVGERIALGLSPFFFAMVAVPLALSAKWKHALTSFLPGLLVVVLLFYPLVLVAKVQGRAGRWDPVWSMFLGDAALLVVSMGVMIRLMRR